LKAETSRRSFFVFLDVFFPGRIRRKRPPDLDAKNSHSTFRTHHVFAEPQVGNEARNRVQKPLSETRKIGHFFSFLRLQNMYDKVSSKNDKVSSFRSLYVIWQGTKPHYVAVSWADILGLVVLGKIRAPGTEVAR